MSDKALTKPSVTAIWADRGDVRELMQRLKQMMPGGQKLTDGEAASLAQAAIIHGLDPLNGELWWIPGSGLMAGIKGHRRAAHNQLEQEGGGNYWPEFERLDVDEQAALGIPPDALAFRCILRDTRTVNHYTEQIERLMKAIGDWDIVEGIVGKRPYTSGVGYAMPTTPDPTCTTCKGSGWYRDNNNKNRRCDCYESSKMTQVQLAQKRAEADALKRRFDLQFGIGVGSGGDAPIDGEFVVSKDCETPEETLERGREILHGTEEEADWDAVPEWRNHTEAALLQRLNALKDKAAALGIETPGIAVEATREDLWNIGLNLKAAITEAEANIP